MTKKEQLQQELTRLNRLRKNVKKELKNLDSFVGKWWAHERGDIVFVTHEGYSGSLYGYGFDSDGVWFDYTDTTCNLCALNSEDKKYSIVATECQVKEALIKEANRRGYEKGAVIKSLIDGDEKEIFSNDFYFNSFPNYFNCGNAHVFSKGKWAEVVEQDKFAELKEAHMNGAIIEIKWNDGSWKSIKNPSWDERNEYRIKPEEKPNVGDVCKFWDSNEDNCVVGILDAVESWFLPYKMHGGLSWDNARAITKEEAIELLYGHK